MVVISQSAIPTIWTSMRLTKKTHEVFQVQRGVFVEDVKDYASDVDDIVTFNKAFRNSFRRIHLHEADVDRGAYYWEENEQWKCQSRLAVQTPGSA
jgi:hypothetical protein